MSVSHQTPWLYSTILPKNDPQAKTHLLQDVFPLQDVLPFHTVRQRSRRRLRRHAIHFIVSARGSQPSPSPSPSPSPQFFILGQRAKGWVRTFRNTIFLHQAVCFAIYLELHSVRNVYAHCSRRAHCTKVLRWVYCGGSWLWWWRTTLSLAIVIFHTLACHHPLLQPSSSTAPSTPPSTPSTSRHHQV